MTTTTEQQHQLHLDERVAALEALHEDSQTEQFFGIPKHSNPERVVHHAQYQIARLRKKLQADFAKTSDA